MAASNLWISELLYFIGFALRMPAESWLYDYDPLAANELALRCSAGSFLHPSDPVLPPLTLDLFQISFLGWFLFG